MPGVNPLLPVRRHRAADVRNTKSMTVRQQRTAEGEAILRQLADGDYVTLLDERGEIPFGGVRAVAPKTG